MTYAQRMKRSAVASVLIHVLLLAAPWSARSARDSWGLTPHHAPLVLNLQPPQAIRRLADVQTPAGEPVQPTDLIGEFDAQAADEVLRDGGEAGPQVDEVAEFDMLAASPAPAAPTPPAPPQPMLQEDATDATAESPAQMTELEPDTVPDAPLRVADARISTPSPILPPHVPLPPSMPPSFPDYDSPAADRPAPLEEESRTTKGRVRDQVKQRGLAGFEAMQDQIAPYLREVRRRVERRWHVALLTRYSGVHPTEAVIDCAIAPDGSLLFARIVGRPQDRVFAALCRAALEQAAPFPPFPFEMPDLYREKHLEIRWTFSFLQR